MDISMFIIVYLGLVSGFFKGGSGFIWGGFRDHLNLV